MDDNKMSIKAINWYSICLMNVCVKDIVDEADEDVILSLIVRQAF